MIGLLIALVVVSLLGFLPIGVRLLYDKDGGFVWFKFGFVRFKLYPQDKKEQTSSKIKKNSNQVKKTASKTQGGSLTEFLPIARIVLDFLSDFRRKLWVQNLQLRATLAEDDPSDLAVHYGQAWCALGSFMPLLEQYVKIKNRDLQIVCDFTAEKSKIYARADILISLGRFLSIGLRHGIRGLRKYFKISKKIKAVQ